MTINDSLLLHVLRHLTREQEQLKEKKENLHLTKKGMFITITASVNSANTLTKSTAFKELQNLCAVLGKGHPVLQAYPSRLFP
jgi:hypothetical protein